MRSFIMSCLIWLTGCQSIAFYMANIGNRSIPARVFSDIDFDSPYDQRLDVYAPEDISTPRDVIVYVYGGSWDSGDKSNYEFVARQFVAQGYVVVIPDYVKYPEAIFPAFIDDLAMASRWVHDHIQEYGGNPNHVNIIGHSAGAYNAAMLVTDDKYLEAQGLDKDFYKSFIGMSGPYNFTATYEPYLSIFPKEVRDGGMQVSSFIQGNEPTTLLLHGGSDDLVWEENLVTLSAKINEKGGRVETHVYDDVGHINIIGSLSPSLNLHEEVFRDIMEFLKPLSSTSLNATYNQ